VVAAALVALFWALHPLRVESVAWISSRKDILSFFFELLALLAWVGHLKSVHGREWFLRGKYWLSFLFFALATMAKPSAMTFPVIAALLDVFVIRGEREGEKWRWRQYVPMLAYAAFIAVLAQRAQVAGGAVGNTGAPLWWRVVNAVAGYGVYILHTAWPSDLAVQCMPRWPGLPRYLAVGVSCVAAAGGFMAWRVVRHWGRLKEFRRVDDLPLAGLAIFTLAVGPFLGIASFGYHAYADRFTYVPALGICVLLTGWMAKLSERAFPSACCCFAALLPLLAGRSWWQTGFWKNDETLFRRTVQVDDGKNVLAHNNLAAYYYEVDHDPAKVVEEYEKGRMVDENLAMYVADLYICALFESGRYEKGDEELDRFRQRLFEKLERERVRHHQTRQEVSTSFRLACIAQAIAKGEYDLAIGHLDAVRRSFPDYPYCDYLEGVMCLKQGYHDKALALWRKIHPAAFDSYSRFRWLKAALPADDAEALEVLPSLAWKTPDDAEGPVK
jgi:tetratricopeptide (TPR) repeat protein